MSNFYLVITPFFPTKDSFRGPFILDQVKAIEKTERYKLVVFKPKPWYSREKDYEYEGVKVYRFSTFELPSNILPGLFNPLTVWSMFRKFKKMGLKLRDIEVVHTHITGTGFMANALKKRNPRIKTILQHHGFDLLSLENGRLCNFKPHRLWVKEYGINICNKIDLHVGVSQKTLDYLTAYPEIKVKNQYVLYNGVDTTKFYSIKGLNNPDFFTIGCIGNFWPLKDQITLLKAANQLVKNGMINLRIKLVGTGQTFVECKKYVEGHQLETNTEFIDVIPHNQLVQFYNSLDLFVLPSYHEAFGCVYLEAFACGVPFMAVKDQGIAELIPDNEKDKWLIGKGDTNQLAKLILNYADKRYTQELNANLEITCLVPGFLDVLESLLTAKANK